MPMPMPMPTPLQPELFRAQAAFALVAGSLPPHPSLPQSAFVQQRLDKLFVKVQTLTKCLADTQALADAFRPLYNSTLAPLHAERQARRRSMALWLDEWLQKKNVRFALRRDATAMLCGLSASLATGGDVGMRTLHDRHSTVSLRDKEKAAAARHAMLQQEANADPSDWHDAELAHDLLHPTVERPWQQALDEQAALRTIYRQLASALHPDRELDATARLRKTEMMGQVNAAYARRDLMALLTLQLQGRPLDILAISHRMADKMGALTTLLKAQATLLEEDVAMAQAQLGGEFGFSAVTPVTLQGLTLALDEQARTLLGATALMRQDVQRVKTDTGLKNWLKAQQKQSAWTALPTQFFDAVPGGF